MDEEFEVVGFEPVQEEEPESFEIVGFEPPEAPKVEDTTPDANWFSVAALTPLKGLSSIGRGAGGLVEAFGDLTGLESVSQFGQETIDSADETDRRIREDWLGLEEDDAKNTFLNIGGEVIGTLAPTVGGAKAKLGKWALASLPAVFQSGSKYEALQDRGASDGEALMGAAASLPLNTLFNRVDVGAALKPLQGGTGRELFNQYAKRGLGLGAIGATTNAAAAFGDAAIDKQIANTPLSFDEMMQSVGMGAVTGGLTGAGMSVLAPRARAESAVDVLARMEQMNQGAPLADAAPQPLLALPAPEGKLYGDNFVATDVPPYSELPGVPKTSLAEPTLIEGSPVVEAPPLIDAQPSQPEGLVIPEPGMGARTDAEIRDAINLREGATKLQIDPIVDPLGNQVVPEPVPQPQPKIYKPLTSKGQLRQDLLPEERQVAEHILGSKDYKAQKAAAEEAAQIREEVLLRENSPRVSEFDKRGIIVSPENQSFPKPIDFKPKGPDADLVIDVQPKPGEQIDLPYEPTSLVVTDLSSRSFAEALEQRARIFTPNKSEGGFLPVGEIIQTLKDAKKAALSPLDTLDSLVGRFKTKPITGDDYKGLNKTYERYNDGIGGKWARHLEWMDTTAKNVPQAKRFIEAGWEQPHNQSAIVWDANKTLEPFLSLSKEEQVPAMSALSAARAMNGKGKKFVISEESLVNLGLTPAQAKAGVAINKWARASNELNRAEAIAQLEHEYFKESTAAERGSVTPQDLTEKLTEIGRRYQAKKLEVNKMFDEMAESNYVPFNRYGEHYAEVANLNGDREWRQFESVREMNKFIQQAKKWGYKVEKTGRLQTVTTGKHQGIPADILAVMGDESTGVPVQGFRKHLMSAKLIPGADVDLSRSIPEYVLAQARYHSINRMERAMERELMTSLSSKEMAPLTNKLTAWKDSLTRVQGSAARAINQGFNTAYIGGNLRTPIADVLGRVQLQYPLIAKYTSGLSPEKHLLKSAAKEVLWYAGKLNDKRLVEAIESAQRRNIIGSTVSREMFRKAQGGKTTLNTIHDLYFGLKSLTERSTDLGGYITGWDIYPEAVKKLQRAGEEIPTRAEFAERFVQESKAVPNKGELPSAMNNDTVRLMAKYRTFQLKILKTYFEGMKDGEYGQLLRQATATIATSGLMGLPFLRDFVVASRAAGVEPETEVRRNLPEDLADMVIYGPASKATGVDLSGSTGFGEVLPGVGTGAKDAMYKAALGILGAPAEGIDKAINFADRGRTLKALASIPFMPQLASNLLNAADQLQRGVQTMGGEGVVPREELSLMTPLLKAMGLTDLEVKKAYAAQNVRAQAKRRDNNFYNQQIADAKYREDMDEVVALKRQAKQEGIKIDQDSIDRKVNAMRGDKKALMYGIPEAKRKQVEKDLKLYRR